MGIAVAGIAVGAYAMSSYGDLSATCAGSASGCGQDDVDAVETNALVANVLFGIAGAAGLVAVIVFIAEPGSDEPEASATFHLAPGGATALVRF